MHARGSGWRVPDARGKRRFISPTVKSSPPSEDGSRQLLRNAWARARRAPGDANDAIQTVYQCNARKPLKTHLISKVRISFAAVTCAQATVLTTHNLASHKHGVIPDCDYRRWTDMAIIDAVREGVLPSDTPVHL